MTTIKNICYGRKYTDKSGNEKTQWTTIGKLFIKDDGKMSIQFDLIPTAWNGNCAVFDNDREQVPQKPQQPQAQQADKMPWD